MMRLTTALAGALILSACSGELNEAQLRPPPEWRRHIAGSVATIERQAESAVHAAQRSVGATSSRVSASALAGAIRFSRDQALQADLRPIPPKVRQALAPYFEAALLEKVQWTLAGRRISLGSFLAGWYYDEGAVTLVDVVVWSDEDLTQNIWLWAHELAHVEQYQRLGVDRFSLQYLANWQGLEAAASQRAYSVTGDIRARRSTAARSGESAPDPAGLIAGAPSRPAPAPASPR